MSLGRHGSYPRLNQTSDHGLVRGWRVAARWGRSTRGSRAARVLGQSRSGGGDGAGAVGLCRAKPFMTSGRDGLARWTRSRPGFDWAHSAAGPMNTGKPR